MNEQTINKIKIGTNIFLAVAILLLVWQFWKADTITKDIALSDSPTTLISAYENITGQECICGYGVKNKILSMKDNSYENKDIFKNLSLSTKT